MIYIVPVHVLDLAPTYTLLGLSYVYVNNNRSLLGGRQSFINIYVIVGRSQVSTSKRQAFDSFQSKLASFSS